MKEIIRNIFSRPLFQKFFELILNFCLKVLNIGEGQSVNNSGEVESVNLLNRVNGDDELVVFDVGAHHGEWLEMFSSNINKKYKLYSFEPSKRAFSVLSSKKTEFIIVENIALGDSIDKKFISGSESGSVDSKIVDGSRDDYYEAVLIDTLDTYCLKKGIEKIDLLKLDVEGYELKIISGAMKMINQDRIKFIQFEFGALSGEKYTLKDFFDVLGDKYQICRILRNGYYPLKEYKHYYEIMTITNFIAIRKDIINL